MLSKQEILEMKTKILSARSYLLREHPFFGVMLMYLKYVAGEDMEQITTNGISIFVSPRWMKWYSMNELSCLLCHQVMHILMGDIYRPLSSKGDEYHYERDVEVKKALAELGVGNYYVYIRSIAPTKTRKSRNTDWWDDEEEKPRIMVDNDEMWSDRTDYVENGVLILNTQVDIEENVFYNSSGRIEEDTLSSYWQNIALSCGLQAGNVPACVKLRWKNDSKGKLNWRKILRDFIQEEVYDYSFCPPDRRLQDTDCILPDFNDKECVVKDLLFMVDTSGSMNTNVLMKIYSEIKTAIEQFNGKIEGKIGFFDVKIVEPKAFSCYDDFEDIEPYGGGGTDFSPVFEYIENEYADIKPSCIIIFTDGFGTFPDEVFTQTPVLWLISDNESFEAPFGKIVHVDKKEWRI